jgi:gamma-glutamylcyclotransferase (GGCT)/AIG2-like uncharacterized protein YtfP
MQEKVFKLFVYGSLRSGFHHPAYNYISKYFRLVGDAKVKGELYDMGDFPAAIPSDAEAFITGELYELKQPGEFSWAFEQLDDYEGVHPEEGEIALYRRELATAYVGDEGLEAWIYWFNGTVDDRPKIPSGDVLQFLHQKSKL